MRKKYMPRALGPLLLVVLSPAVAQQNDDNEIIVSASRSNRTVAEMAQTTWVIESELCCNEGQRKMGEYVIEYLLQGKKRYLSLVLRSV